MYVYCIAMKFTFCLHKYALIILYFLCKLIMSHYFFYHGFHTFINYVKKFENKFSFFFTSLFHKILHSYNLFSSNESVYKGLKHPFIY